MQAELQFSAHSHVPHSDGSTRLATACRVSASLAAVPGSSALLRTASRPVAAPAITPCMLALSSSAYRLALSFHKLQKSLVVIIDSDEGDRAGPCVNERACSCQLSFLLHSGPWLLPRAVLAQTCKQRCLGLTCVADHGFSNVQPSFCGLLLLLLQPPQFR